MSPHNWAVGFRLKLMRRVTPDLNTVCLIQDIIYFYDGWFISVKPEVCTEVFLLMNGRAIGPRPHLATY